MSTYVKSVYLARVGLAGIDKPVEKNQIIEVADDVAEKLLTRTAWSEDLGKEVNVWEKSTAAAYKAQQEKAAKDKAAEQSSQYAAQEEGNDDLAPKPIPLQQVKNTNDTHEDQNDPADDKDTARKAQPVVEPTEPNADAKGKVVTTESPPAIEGAEHELDENHGDLTSADLNTNKSETEPAKPAAKAAAKPAVKVKSADTSTRAVAKPQRAAKPAVKAAVKPAAKPAAKKPAK